MVSLSMQCSPGSFSYTIQAGDTLYQLAQTYHTTVDAIVAVNPGINPDVLFIGQTVCIPGTETLPTTCPTGYQTYTIQSGDTLYSLAAQFNTTVEAIQSANPGVDPDSLQIGQTICLPGTMMMPGMPGQDENDNMPNLFSPIEDQDDDPPEIRCPFGSAPHTIARGENIYDLARRYNTTVGAILAANPGINPNALYIGQVICIPGAAPPSQCPAGSRPYIIRAGENLYELARRFGTTVNVILSFNPGLNPNALYIGQRICIPGGITPPTTCPAGSRSYTIQAGDNIYGLARRFGTTVGAILAVNPGLNPSALYVGQTICIPGTVTPPTTCPPGSTSYTIRAGDTLHELARRFRTTVGAILAANPGLNPSALYIGQRICIPGTVTPPTTCPVGSTSYVIRSGENLYGLALRFGTTVGAILAINPGLNPNALYVGQTICIPGTVTPPTTCPAGTFPYAIQSGDNFYSLAIRFNTTIGAIQSANPGVNPNSLYIGQTICIPGRRPR